MRYLSQIEASRAGLIVTPVIAAAKSHAANFSELEWSVIRLARIDRLWTIRPAGPVRRFWMWAIGRSNPQLANERLEALRQMAVLSWHHGFTVHGSDVAEFLAAGFSSDQYELLVSSVRDAQRSRAAPRLTAALA